jgi:glycosyltransferase involved in cell wall biosynthesis
LRRALAYSERTALARAVHVVVTSPITARTLVEDYGVPADKITVAVPGTEPAARAKGSEGVVRLLCVGTVSPRKAYGVLVEALSELKDRDWILDIAGETDRVEGEYDRVREAIARFGLEDRVRFIGVLDRPALDAAYAATDLFLMPSLYEGYGMVLAEAMARGLPIVCTTGGAAAETVPDGAGLKVPPGDAPALRGAIARLLDDAGLRRSIADASWKAGQALPRWQDTAAIVAGAINRVATTMRGAA